MLAAQLNELGISQQPPPEAPARNNRQGVPPAAVSAGGAAKAAAAVVQPVPTGGSSNNHVAHINPLDPIECSDTDSEPEETNERGRNDGTLLASDPPKPL